MVMAYLNYVDMNNINCQPVNLYRNFAMVDTKNNNYGIAISEFF